MVRLASPMNQNRTYAPGRAEGTGFTDDGISVQKRDDSAIKLSLLYTADDEGVAVVEHSKVVRSTWNPRWGGVLEPFPIDTPPRRDGAEHCLIDQHGRLREKDPFGIFNVLTNEAEKETWRNMVPRVDGNLPARRRSCCWWRAIPEGAMWLKRHWRLGIRRARRGRS